MLLVCEGELVWCVRRVFSSLAMARLDADSFFGDALQNAKQLFFSSLPKMTRYFVMREGENVPTGISQCCNSAFAQKKEFSIFKSLKGFWRSLAEISLHWLLCFLFIQYTTLITMI
jgi:hypothetical protein